MMIHLILKKCLGKALLLALCCAGFTGGSSYIALAANVGVGIVQQITKGVVVDENGVPIAGASVAVEGTSISTVTDESGAFTLSDVPADASLTISYLGYANQTITVAGQTTLRITLTPDEHTLDEAVVIGYGTVKKSSLTSAVSSMDARAIENRPLARAESALQGQLAGVAVRTTTGEPGADMQIRVRGAASVNA